jgi:hypothetical protein
MSVLTIDTNPPPNVKKSGTDACPSPYQHPERTLLDWLRVEYGIEKPSNKLLAVTDLDSDTWVGEVKRIRGSGEEG